MKQNNNKVLFYHLFDVCAPNGEYVTGFLLLPVL